MRSAALIVLAACRGGSAAPDARPIDGPITIYDEQSFDPVQVTVRASDSTLQPGVSVYFFQPDGTLNTEFTTDTNGVASATIDPGGSVAAVIHGNGFDEVDAILDVQPGDHLTTGGFSPFTDLGTFTVDFPIDALATSYEVWGPCGPAQITGLSGTLYLDSSCLGSASDIVAIAKDAAGAPLDGLVNTNITFADGGSATLTGTWTSLASFTATYTNLPADESATVAHRTSNDAGYPSTDGIAHAGPGFTTTAPFAPTASAIMTTDLLSTSFAAAHVFERINGGDTAYALDGSQLLPEFATPFFAPGNSMLLLPRAGTGTADAFQTYVDAVHSDGFNVYWYVESPDLAQLVMPALPADADTAVLAPTDTIAATRLFATSWSGGSWDVARADLPHAFDLRSLVNAGATFAQRSESPSD